MKITFTIFLALLTVSSFGQKKNGYEKVKAIYDKGERQEVIDLATVELKKIKMSDTAFKKILRLRVDCYMKLENYPLAIADWKILLKLAPNDHSFYENLAYAYGELRDWPSCISSIDKAYLIAPKDPWVLSNMSYYYSKVGRYKESVNYATVGLSQKNVDNESKATLFNNRGFAYLELQQPIKALVDINKSIALNPDNSFAYCYRALANIELKKWKRFVPI